MLGLAHLPGADRLDPAEVHPGLGATCDPAWDQGYTTAVRRRLSDALRKPYKLPYIAEGCGHRSPLLYPNGGLRKARARPNPPVGDFCGGYLPAPMRELVAELFVSLDGYAFSANAGPYFDLYGPELGELIEERLAEPQELVMGHRTHQMLGAMAGSPEGTDPLARRMDELPKTVLSHGASMPLPWTRSSGWPPAGDRADRRVLPRSSPDPLVAGAGDSPTRVRWLKIDQFHVAAESDSWRSHQRTGERRSR